MDVRTLKTALEQKAEKTNANKLLTVISHWEKRIFEANKGQYSTRDFKDLETLEKLVELGIVSLKRGSGDFVVAELTKEGRELYMDFMKLGYYL